MYRLLLPLFVLSFLGFAGNAQSTFATLLSGHQEVPSTTTRAEGTVEMTLRGDSLDVEGEIGRLSSQIDFALAGGAHIHSGYIGQNGPVVLPIRIIQDADFNAEFVDTTYFVGDIPNFEALLNNGTAYVNVHTLDWANGEVRGQIVNITDNRVTGVFDAMMYGDQQNSPVLTDGMGGIMAVIDDQEMMTISGSFAIESELTDSAGTGIHLHIGYVGQNGPVALALTPTMDATRRTGVFEASNNTFSLSSGLDTLVQAMRERRVYVNVHSENNPSGELRGQLVDFNNNVYFSYVSYSDPTPFPIAESVMRVMAEKVMLEDSIKTSGSYTGWNRNLLAAPLDPFVQILNPENGIGLTIFPLADDRAPNGSSGVLPLNTRFANEDALIGLKDRLSTRAGWAIPSGASVPFDSEFHHECKRAFHSQLTGSQTLPATNSDAFGHIVTEYYTDRIESIGTIGSLSSPIDVSISGGIQIRSGFAGESGPPLEIMTFQVVPLSSGGFRNTIAPGENLKFLTQPESLEMRFGGLYHNVHTANYPTGEIRGQILPRANVLIHGIMSAGQAVPGGGPSPANGAIMGELYSDKVVYTGSFNDLAGGFSGRSHIHGNVAGRTGNVMVPLLSGATVGSANGVFFSQNNTHPVNSSIIDSLVLRVTYANIHSQAVPSGELRGQIGPLATNVTHAVLSPDVTVPYTGMQGLSTGTGHLHGEVYGNNLVISGAMTGLSSAIDTARRGGVHLHGATVAETGGIITPLQLLLDSAQTSAILNPALNNFTLSDTDIAQLLNGDIYVNVHTLDAGSGAIRGQMLMSENQYPEASPLFRFPSDGMMLDLGSADGSTVAGIDWVAGQEFDSEQDLASFWQLYSDTTMMPIFQSQVADGNGVSLTFAQIDDLLMNLGVAEGEMATVYHRAASTDGSLIAYSSLSEVTFTRRFVSGLNELPTGAARLVNTLSTQGGSLLLDVEGLEAGQLTYQITGMSGNILTEQQLQHGGTAQRYEFPNTINQAGMYALTLRDEQGRISSWMFVVK